LFEYRPRYFIIKELEKMNKKDQASLLNYLRNAFADLHCEEQETFASGGDKVVQILTITGKHTRNFFVIPPTGNNISCQAVHIHRIGEDGKIVEYKAIRDDLKFMMQLGLVDLASPEYEQLFQAWKGFKQ
jgi:predicted ester cyclase